MCWDLLVAQKPFLTFIYCSQKLLTYWYCCWSMFWWKLHQLQTSHTLTTLLHVTLLSFGLFVYHKKLLFGFSPLFVFPTEVVGKHHGFSIYMYLSQIPTHILLNFCTLIWRLVLVQKHFEINLFVNLLFQIWSKHNHFS